MVNRGYEVNINSHPYHTIFHKNDLIVKISVPFQRKDVLFRWSEIKDDFITAFEALNEKYTITKIGVDHFIQRPPDFSTEKTYSKILYNLTNVVNNKIDSIKGIDSINLYIKG